MKSRTLTKRELIIRVKVLEDSLYEILDQVSEHTGPMPMMVKEIAKQALGDGPRVSSVLDTALKRVSQLMDADKDTSEGEELMLLVDFVEVYESYLEKGKK